MSNYWKKKLDELNAENQKKSSGASNPADYWGNKLTELKEANSKKEDISPVVESQPEEKSKLRDRWQENMSDGYQFGDVTKSILGIDEDSASFKDLTLNSIQRGYLNARYGEESFKELSGERNSKEAYKEKLSADDYQFTPNGGFAEAVSGAFELVGQQARQFTHPRTVGLVTGAVTTAVLAGQAGPQALLPEEVVTAPVAAAAALASGSAINAVEIEGGHAYNEMLEQGISKETARNIALAVGGVNGALDLVQADELVKAYKVIGKSGVSKSFMKKLGEVLLDRGIDVAKETVQEVAQEGVTIGGTQLASKLETGEYAYSAEEVKDRLGDTAKSSALSFGMMNVPATGSNIVSISKEQINANTANKLTENEEAVVNKVYEDYVAEAEKDGKTLTNAEKKKLREKVISEMEKGYISTDTIESVLGGDVYKMYQNSLEKDTNTKAELEKEIGELVKTPESQFTVEQRERLTELRDRLKELENDGTTQSWKETLNSEISQKLQNSRLVESYNEQTRRGQTFTADISKYDTKQQAVIQKAIDSGILNNTNRTHDFVDMIAKISADKGVSFDFTDNDKLKNSGFALAGKTVNGYVTKDGVTLNIDSQKSLNSVVGHEITHVLEGTEFYTELQNTLFEYAKTRGEYDSRLANLTELYKGIKDADVNAELTADLVGDYLFADSEYITHLSTTNRNVFQKLYDEVKYLYSIATAGSKEARELEKLKHTFEKAYKASGKATSGTKYSVSDSDGKQLTAEQSEYFKNSKMRDNNGNLKVMYHGTNETFTVFDKKKARSSGYYGRGFYFTDSDSHARHYGNTHEVYLNITNPLQDGTNDITKEQLRKFVEVLAENEDYGIDNYGYGATVDSVVDSVFGKSDFAMLMDLNVSCVGDMVAAIELFNEINGTNYDGIVTPTETVAFYPEQIKATTNQKPTSDSNIYNSLSAEGEQQKRYGNDVYGEDIRLKKSPTRADFAPIARDRAKERISFEDFANRDSSVWRNVKYNDTETKARIMRETHDKMLSEGAVVKVSDDVIAEVGNSFPDVRDMKKRERVPILKEAMNKLKSNIRQYLNGFKNQGFEFEVNGRVLDAKLYSTGINEVLDKITQEKANMLYSTEEIFKNAQYLYSTPDYDGDPNVYRWNYFYTPVQIGEEIVGVRIAVRDLAKQGESQIYNWGIKKDTSLGGVRDDLTNRKSYDASSDVSLDTSLGGVQPVVSNSSHDASSDVSEDIIAENDKIVKPQNEIVAEDFAPITEDEANAMASESLDSLTDADVPPEMDAPYYGEGEEVTVDDPFESRDIKEVGNRKVKAYMYENPEVKPFFQAEARTMLGDLERGIKGERYYVETPDGRPGVYGSDSYGYFDGTKRLAHPDIEYLLDECHYTYKQIEDGLNAIIEDHGAENNAVSKRIEFLINDRLLNGTVELNTFGGALDIPPNQDYINLLNEKQITEYNEEAKRRFFEVADDFAPIAETPIAETKVTEAPIAEAYEAIRPPRQSAESRTTEAEPRMKRVDSTSNAPDGMEERSWVGTSTGSEAVDGIITPDDIPDDVRYYQVKSNKKTLETANARLARDGYAKSREYFEGRMSERKLTVEDIALGERLIQEAAKAGDAQAVRDLIIDVSILGTELGQRVQALSMINRLTPEGQLKALIRTVERGKAKGDKAFDGVEVTEDMVKQITDTIKEDGTFDQAELDAAVEDVKQQIADQMSVSFMDKVNAWRYLSMLGNPKTHIRNLVSNVAMMGTRTVKNAVARTIEDISPIKNRTKTWRQSTDAVKAFAKATTTEMEAAVKGDNKYSDEGSLKAKRKIFGIKVIDAVNNANTKAMEWEDAIFSKNVFRTTLQEYLTANGVKTEQDIKNNPELVAKAKEYALEESRRATFRQDSYLANKIGEVEQRNAFYGVAVGSVMPFKRTPINIAKTGAAYSPLGIARNIYDAVQVGKGSMDASEAIDHLAQTLTGTSLALIGYALASSGVLNGAGDDDKEGKYDYQLGKQSYSFNFGGDTYSLSWLSPIAMPLFVGANAYETLVEKNEWDMNVVIDTLGQTLDPMSEMSFISSLDDVLSSYDSGMAKIWGAGESLVQNYATQFIPTLSSQIAATFDDTKRSTKASKDSGFTFGEETLNKIKYKIPVLRNSLAPTTDIWGNGSKQTENALARGFESFLSPANKREGIATAVDEELKSLYSEVGKAEILPAIPYDYIDYGGEKHDMSSKDYTEYKQTYGQTAYELMESLFDTNTYKNATSEEKADMVADVYDYARDAAKKEYLTKQGVNFTNSTSEGVKVFKENPIKGAIAADLPVDEYVFKTDNPKKYSFFKANGITYSDYKNADENGKRAYTWAYKNPEMYTVSKAITSDLMEYRSLSGDLYDIKADKDASGKSISGSRKDKVAEYINGLDLDYGEKLILFKSEYNADDTYNYEIVEYLNGRADISYEDTVTILKELGFKVDSKGNVTWD